METLEATEALPSRMAAAQVLLIATLLNTHPTRLYGGAALVALAVAQIIYDEGFHLSAVKTRTRR